MTEKKIGKNKNDRIRPVTLLPVTFSRTCVGQRSSRGHDPVLRERRVHSHSLTIWPMAGISSIFSFCSAQIFFSLYSVARVDAILSVTFFITCVGRRSSRGHVPVLRERRVRSRSLRSVQRRVYRRYLHFALRKSFFSLYSVAWVYAISEYAR